MRQGLGQRGPGAEWELLPGNSGGRPEAGVRLVGPGGRASGSGDGAVSSRCDNTGISGGRPGARSKFLGPDAPTGGFKRGATCGHPLEECDGVLAQDLWSKSCLAAPEADEWGRSLQVTLATLCPGATVLAKLSSSTLEKGNSGAWAVFCSGVIAFT